MRMPNATNCDVKSNRGFTLVEVLIALAVAALAAVGVFLGYQQAVDRTNTNQTVRQIQIIAAQFADKTAIVGSDNATTKTNMLAAVNAAGIDCTGDSACFSPYRTHYVFSATGSSLKVEITTNGNAVASGLLRVLSKLEGITPTLNTSKEKVDVVFG